ncbi:hypothetical protein VP01_1225g6 [Puccinia sorghi]|uniref:RING-type domain-containing protein n=1 Tax=Puccinia sorghi TaxID=27349 RepID=A0A0L6VRE4_9BASI|nr:hypothetical protein VP01_1225g6 [Puccinia sorghi]
MSGHVYYRFKSQKDFQRIIFEGIGISVWDLKREIILEKYANDHTIIPRSSSVIARRLPPKRPGHGNAQQYVGNNLTGSNSRTNPPLTAHVDWRGGGAISKDFRNRSEIPSSNPPAEVSHHHASLDLPSLLLNLMPSYPQTLTPVLTGGERDSEAESMAAMFAAQDQQWQKTQETMATFVLTVDQLFSSLFPFSLPLLQFPLPPRNFRISLLQHQCISLVVCSSCLDGSSCFEYLLIDILLLFFCMSHTNQTTACVILDPNILDELRSRAIPSSIQTVPLIHHLRCRNMGFRDRGGGQHRLNKGRENSTLNLPTGPGSSSHPNPTNSTNGQFQAPPPQGYICYRCGQKGKPSFHSNPGLRLPHPYALPDCPPIGILFFSTCNLEYLLVVRHWIQACPTNDNPDFEGRPRIKRTTGIPKSFLQKVENGTPVDGQNVMVTSDGSFVIAKPDNATWKQHKSVVVKNLSAADIENQRPSDPDLVCSICLKLLKKSVKMVCCSSSFCESCISNYLKTHSSVCPECETKVSFNPSSSSSSSTHPNNNKAFIIDDERRKRSDDYIQEILKISQAAQLEQAKSNEDQTTAETSSSKPALDALEADTNSKREGESQSQASKVDESSPKPDQSSQPKDDSKSGIIIGVLMRIDLALKPSGAMSTEVARLSPSESKNGRTGIPGSEGSSQMMNGTMEYGNKEYEGYGTTPHGMTMTNGGGNNMGMIHGMPGMGYGGNGMMDGMMMHGIHSNQMGFAGNGMSALDMGSGAGPEAMLGVQLNQVLMMLQNPQLNEPLRMQLLIQQQTLQQQLAMVHRMAGSNLMDHHHHHNNMMDQMNMGAGNPLLMHLGSGHFGTPLGLHQQQTDFNNNSFGPFGGMGNFAGHHQQLGFPTNALQAHHHSNNAAGGGMGMKQFNQQQQQHTLNNMTPNMQRPLTAGVGGGGGNNNHFHRRVHPFQPPHHQLLTPSNHPAPHYHHQTKRKRPEDLIELESGEKVPRYM